MELNLTGLTDPELNSKISNNTKLTAEELRQYHSKSYFGKILFCISHLFMRGELLTGSKLQKLTTAVENMVNARQSFIDNEPYNTVLEPSRISRLKKSFHVNLRSTKKKVSFFNDGNGSPTSEVRLYEPTGETNTFIQPSDPKPASVETKGVEDSKHSFIVPERRIPPVSLSVDTVIRAPSGIFASAHGQATFIQDANIIKVHAMRYPPLQDGLHNGLKPDAIGVAQNGKHVVLQQATRGCVAAATAMLVLDNGKEPDYYSLYTTNLANEESSIGWIKAAGLTPRITSFSKVKDNNEKCRQLEEKLNENGPGVLSINAKTIGGHAIILDKIDGDKATIRDPYHGWMVTVATDLLLGWESSHFIQIEGGVK